MSSAAAIAVAWLRANVDASASAREDVLAEVPAFQWAALDGWWGDLAQFCPSRIVPPTPHRNDGLNLAFAGATTPRCLRRSPDGRGLAWLASGGSSTAYLPCEQCACDRAMTDLDPGAAGVPAGGPEDQP